MSRNFHIRDENIPGVVFSETEKSGRGCLLSENVELEATIMSKSFTLSSSDKVTSGSIIIVDIDGLPLM